MRNVILGTDWGSDCDDVVAVRILSRFAKENKVNLLGIGINEVVEYSVASLKAFLSNEGMDNVPVGIDHSAVNFEDIKFATYQERLAKNYCPDITNKDAPDAMRLYRQLIANADGKVEIMEIGFLQVLANLLMSGPDDISDKTGLELVKEKVSKIWIMAGNWTKDGEMEHNFCLNSCTRRGGRIVCEICPVPITFLGFEIGIDVMTGNKLKEDDLLHRVMLDYGCTNGRDSWDPMLVLMALTGDEEKAGYTMVQGTASLDEETGKNYFKRDLNGLHKFVVKKYEDSYYIDKINAIIA